MENEQTTILLEQLPSPITYESIEHEHDDAVLNRWFNERREHEFKQANWRGLKHYIASNTDQTYKEIKVRFDPNKDILHELLDLLENFGNYLIPNRANLDYYFSKVGHTTYQVWFDHMEWLYGGK